MEKFTWFLLQFIDEITNDKWNDKNVAFPETGKFLVTSDENLQWNSFDFPWVMTKFIVKIWNSRGNLLFRGDPHEK